MSIRPRIADRLIKQKALKYEKRREVSKTRNPLNFFMIMAQFSILFKGSKAANFRAVSNKLKITKRSVSVGVLPQIYFRVELLVSAEAVQPYSRRPLVGKRLSSVITQLRVSARFRIHSLENFYDNIEDHPILNLTLKEFVPNAGVLSKDDRRNSHPCYSIPTNTQTKVYAPTKSKLQHATLSKLKARVFEFLKIGLFKFPPPRDKMVLNCPTLLWDLSVKRSS